MYILISVPLNTFWDTYNLNMHWVSGGAVCQLLYLFALFLYMCVSCMFAANVAHKELIKLSFIS